MYTALTSNAYKDMFIPTPVNMNNIRTSTFIWPLRELCSCYVTGEDYAIRLNIHNHTPRFVRKRLGATKLYSSCHLSIRQRVVKPWLFANQHVSLVINFQNPTDAYGTHDILNDYRLCAKIRYISIIYAPEQVLYKLHRLFLACPQAKVLKTVDCSDITALFSQAVRTIPNLRSIQCHNLNDYGEDNNRTSELINSNHNHLHAMRIIELAGEQFSTDAWTELIASRKNLTYIGMSSMELCDDIFKNTPNIRGLALRDVKCNSQMPMMFTGQLTMTTLTSLEMSSVSFDWPNLVRCCPRLTCLKLRTSYVQFDWTCTCALSLRILYLDSIRWYVCEKFAHLSVIRQMSANTLCELNFGNVAETTESCLELDNELKKLAKPSELLVNSRVEIYRRYEYKITIFKTSRLHRIPIHIWKSLH